MTRAWSPRSVTSFTAALLIHAAAIGGVLMEFPRPDAAAHPGAGGVMLIVAATAAGSSAGSRKAAQETAPETAPAPEPKLKPEATPPQALTEKHPSPVDVETHVRLKQVVQITPGKTATLSAP
jgi:hypothetical protein